MTLDDLMFYEDELGLIPTIQEPIVYRNFLWRHHSNHCDLIQKEYPEKVDQLRFQILFSFLYAIVWFFAIVGNLTVIYIVTLKHVSMSNVRSVFICSLAISDLVMCLTSLPITAVSIFTRDWVFPAVFCKLSGGGSIFVSSFTLTAIAVDRYVLIRNPAVSKIDFNRAMASVFAIWLLGYSFALPVGVFSKVSSYKPLCGLFCDESWPDTHEESGTSHMRKTYGLLVLIIQFGLPVIISSLCYWSIGRIISRQIKKRHQQQVLLQDNQTRLSNRKNRSNRMMVAMVGGLVFTWLPFNFINLWRDFAASEFLSTWYTLIFAACHLIAMTSSVWNFVIYSWFNPQFKETLLQIVKRQRERPLGMTNARRPSNGATSMLKSHVIASPSRADF
ncbi:G-PROTEIN-RECEP-F1-2 domain-containing protein [Aphelenchoides besseyi]|nr:G-PROTEIN-RECEP-F1-2 domain-containing protein [Aphelenchoides besseyi]